MKNYENPSSCFVVLLVIIHEQVIYQLEMYFRNLPRGWDVLMYDSCNSCMHCIAATTTLLLIKTLWTVSCVCSMVVRKDEAYA